MAARGQKPTFRLVDRMSAMGQKRRLGDVRVTSASPPKADIHREVWHVRLVPKGDNLTNVAQENGRSSSVSLLLAAIEPGKAYPRPPASHCPRPSTAGRCAASALGILLRS